MSWKASGIVSTCRFLTIVRVELSTDYRLQILAFSLELSTVFIQ